MKKKPAASPGETRRRLVLSGLELVCVFFVLCAALTAAWFSIPEDKKHGAVLEAGRIRYSLAGEKNEVFIRHFDLDEEDYEDDDQEIETYIPAQQVGIAVNTDPGAAVTALSLQKTTTVKLQALMTPGNATDKITWTSSDDSILTVSRYGRVKAVGQVGEWADITVHAADRTPENPRQTLTATVRITITAYTGGDDDTAPGFLPAGVECLQNPPLSFINYSSVRSKLRLAVTWSYAPLDPTAEDEFVDGRKIYTVSQLLQGQPSMTWNGRLEDAPLLLDFAGEGTGADKVPHWQAVQADKKAGTLILTDKTGIQWNVTELCLTPDEKTRLQTMLQDGTLPLTAVNQARAIFCYGAAYTGEADYGDVLEPLIQYGEDGGTPTPESLTLATVRVLDGLKASDAYTTYSTLKRFTIRLELQARQADFFVPGQGNHTAGDDWFDVYTCEWDPASGTAHAAHPAVQ